MSKSRQGDQYLVCTLDTQCTRISDSDYIQVSCEYHLLAVAMEVDGMLLIAERIKTALLLGFLANLGISRAA